jgi:hypothetical protein
MNPMRILMISALIAALAALTVGLLSPITKAQNISNALVLDNLSSSKVGKFPHRWRTWPMQRKEASKIYVVAEENGNRFIKAYDEYDLSHQIFYNFNWDIEKRPVLSWKWRATALPAGAAESDDTTNDSACGVYVVFGRYKGHAIKYAWSTTLSPGSVVTRRKGSLKIKILDSGNAQLNRWVMRKINVSKDFEALFGKQLDKNPSGIAILTDGNAVHKPAGCDYADFAISGNK